MKAWLLHLNYIVTGKTNIQLAESHNNCVNAAEPTVKSLKGHALASFAIMGPNCPIQLWDPFTEIIEITLNILRTSTGNKNKSAYHDFRNKKIDWNKTQLASVGTKSLTFKNFDNRCAWQPHGVDTWYLGPSVDHYRLMRFRDPATGGNTYASTFRLYHAHCRTPTISEGDRIVLASTDLVDMLKKEQPESVRERRKHVSILKQLTTILEKPLDQQAPEPRVSKAPDSTLFQTYNLFPTYERRSH